jgi:hypothetical protein
MLPHIKVMTKKQLEAKGCYTINKLSEMIGADRRTLNKRLATEEPDHVFGGKNYYELNRVSDILEEASGKGTDRQKLECKKLICQIENISLRNSEISRRLIPSDEIARTFHRHIGKARSELLAIEDMAAVLCGLSAAEIKEKLKEATRGVIKALHDCPVDEPEDTKNNK